MSKEQSNSEHFEYIVFNRKGFVQGQNCLPFTFKKIYYNLLPVYMYSSVVADEISFILEIYKS